ncbi:MAG: isoprenyl transferase [Desulfobulbus sp.]|nr:MAG: isoprenyl transferase [Desulfobulbus sp.]RUM35353.1 MAG: isoprenyl transferase [Desulfobulbus sp.]
MQDTSKVMEPVPDHVAIIMDGNGRWAEQRKRPRLFGHKAGVDSVRVIVEAARESGVKHLTLYAFSTENWQRPGTEVKGLMALLKTYLQAELAKMLKNQIRLDCFGQADRLPRDVQQILEQVIADTRHCQGMRLNLALSYGSRSEILYGIQKIARKCCDGEVQPDDIDEALLSSNLYTTGQPDPDLLIRTGGEKRLSNFLLWQISYAEIYFTDTMWPDFRTRQFEEAIQEFARRQRRFGKTGGQLAAQ